MIINAIQNYIEREVRRRVDDERFRMALDNRLDHEVHDLHVRMDFLADRISEVAKMMETEKTAPAKTVCEDPVRRN